MSAPFLLPHVNSVLLSNRRPLRSHSLSVNCPFVHVHHPPTVWISNNVAVKGQIVPLSIPPVSRLEFDAQLGAGLKFALFLIGSWDQIHFFPLSLIDVRRTLGRRCHLLCGSALLLSVGPSPILPLPTSICSVVTKPPHSPPILSLAPFPSFSFPPFLSDRTWY